MRRSALLVLLAMVACSITTSGVDETVLARAPLRPFLGLPASIDDEFTGFPRLLSATAIFADLTTLTPRAGIVPYEVNQPLWSDGATKRRWMSVPNDGAPYDAGERITIDHEAAWHFPRGTVFVKHFAMPLDLRDPDGPQRRLETRVLAVRRGGEVYGVTYHWRPDGSDAELLTDGLREDIAVTDERGRPTTIAWSYPSPSQCITCHTPESGGVLGVKTRQLHRAARPGGTDQLVLLSAHGWFDQPIGPDDLAALPRLHALDDTSADLSTRIRSYLDANCSNCHHPGSRIGDNAFDMDLCFPTPLERQGLVDGAVHNPLGIEQGRILAPKQPQRSVLLDRISRRSDPFAMPPLGSGRVDPDLLAKLRQWIDELPASR